MHRQFFHGFIIPFSFRLANSAQYVFFCPLTVLSFNSKPCFVFKSRKAAAMPFSAAYAPGDLCFLSLCGGLVILVPFPPYWSLIGSSCVRPFTVISKYSRTKYSRMAADPRKPRTLNPAKIKAHTAFWTAMSQRRTVQQSHH